jgi:hypothetical protein
MVIQMTTQNYLMVNQSTNVVDNICLWDGNVNTWTPPSDYLMLIQADTPAMVWVATIVDGKITDWVLTEEVGKANIGFTWNGTACVTNQPKPEIPVQPVATGMQTA